MERVEMNLGGGFDPVYNAVGVAELAVEKGASLLLIPISARRQLNDLSDDMATKISILDYADAETRSSRRWAMSSRGPPAPLRRASQAATSGAMIVDAVCNERQRRRRIARWPRHSRVRGAKEDDGVNGSAGSHRRGRQYARAAHPASP